MENILGRLFYELLSRGKHTVSLDMIYQCMDRFDEITSRGLRVTLEDVQYFCDHYPSVATLADDKVHLADAETVRFSDFLKTDYIKAIETACNEVLTLCDYAAADVIAAEQITSVFANKENNTGESDCSSEKDFVEDDWCPRVHFFGNYASINSKYVRRGCISPAILRGRSEFHRYVRNRHIYDFDYSKEVLYIYDHTAVKQFCNDLDIPMGDFNYPVVIDNNVKDCSEMFNRCYTFNQPVEIPSDAIDCTSMFEYCNAFNHPLIIPEKVETCRRMLMFASSFNSPVEIRSHYLQNCRAMFNCCNIFNQDIFLPEGVETCRNMFAGTNFNKPITIPGTVKDCKGMFAYSSFNQPITIPSGVTDCHVMFEGCRDFDQDIVIPQSVVYTQGMFYGCDISNSRITMISGTLLPTDIRNAVMAANEDD